MRIENILREKVYAFSSSPQIEDAEKHLVDDILLQENMGQSTSTLCIDNNDHYDSYKVLCPSGLFCVKVSLDLESPAISTDFDALKSLAIPGFPRAIACGRIKKWNANYSITSFIRAPNCLEMGRFSIVDGMEEFCATEKRVNKTHVRAPIFQDWIAKNYLIANEEIENSLKKIDFSQDAEIQEICSQSLKELSALIEKLADKNYFRQNFLCHGALSPSRVLALESRFSFINFENCFVGNPLIDICGLKYEFYFSDSTEAKILQELKKHHNFSNEEYFGARKLVQCLKFYDLITEFIKQIYVYEGVKHRKILELTEKMSRSFGNFTGIPSFEKHKLKIGELFTNSVL